MLVCFTRAAAAPPAGAIATPPPPVLRTPSVGATLSSINEHDTGYTPAPTVAGTEAMTQTLPDGGTWQKIWDAASSSHYYFNQTTGTSSWTVPAGWAAAGGPPKAPSTQPPSMLASASGAWDDSILNNASSGVSPQHALPRKNSHLRTATTGGQLLPQGNNRGSLFASTPGAVPPPMIVGSGDGKPRLNQYVPFVFRFLFPVVSLFV